MKLERFLELEFYVGESLTTLLLLFREKRRDRMSEN